MLKYLDIEIKLANDAKSRGIINNAAGLKIIGIDEVGRGALAGPIVACSVEIDFGDLVAGSVKNSMVDDANYSLTRGVGELINYEAIHSLVREFRVATNYDGNHLLISEASNSLTQGTRGSMMHDADYSLIQDVRRQIAHSISPSLDQEFRDSLLRGVSHSLLPVDVDSLVYGVKDSKKISPKNRIELYEKIIQKHKYHFGVVSANEIDKINILNANILAVKKASGVDFDFALVDGIMKFDDERYISIKGGDSVSYTIAAASIVAKVYRDCMMREFSLQYPQYGFEKNKGYGTKKHIEAIRKHGFIEGLHRKSFIKRLI